MSNELRHLVSEAPRVMVVDGSKLVRKLIGDVLAKELPGVQVVACAGLAEARAALEAGPVDLVTTALALPDGDGMELARAVRAKVEENNSIIIAAASTAGSGRGHATITSRTPATRAGIAVIRSDDGSGYRPPGT